MGLYLSQMTASRNTAIRYLGNQPVLRPHRIPPAASEHLGGFFPLNNSTTDLINGYDCSLTDGDVNAEWANSPRVDDCVKLAYDNASTWGSKVAFPDYDVAPLLKLTGPQFSGGLDFYHGDANDLVYGIIFSSWRTNGRCFVVRCINNTKVLELALLGSDSTYYYYWASNPVKYHKWYRFMFTYNVGEVSFYFDGELDKNSTSSGTCEEVATFTNDSGPALGEYTAYGSGGRTNMLAANVCFYPNYCLTPWEVAQNASYNYFSGYQSSPAIRYIA